MSTPTAPRLTLTHWLVIAIASIGFLFDTYELLMTPLVAGPAIAELLNVPLNNPLVTEWVGRLLWIAALCGGVFGLLGGWLVDRLGRKTVMALSIFVYSLSPFAAAYATSLPMFVFFRSTTFIGVCVEFVAAITWLSEIFEDRRQREKWLGITQAFASLGGVLVTGVSMWISAHGKNLPHMGLPLGVTDPSSWRYLLLTGLLPAIPIALLLPFVPESQVWRKRASGWTGWRATVNSTRQTARESGFPYFSPRVLIGLHLLTAGLAGFVYYFRINQELARRLKGERINPGLSAFSLIVPVAGIISIWRTGRRIQRVQQSLKIENSISPGTGVLLLALPFFSLAYLQAQLNRVLHHELGSGSAFDSRPRFDALFESKMVRATLTTALLSACAYGIAFGALQVTVARVTPGLPEMKQQAVVLAPLRKEAEALNTKLAGLAADDPARKELIGQIKANFGKQKPLNDEVKKMADTVQFRQEMGGLAGRILLAVLLIAGLSRVALLKVFQVPALVALPLTYFVFFPQGGSVFLWSYFLCGLLTVAQFSYFGEYLPKVFPLHLRGTGGSFATNVGGRMIGTSMAFVNTAWLAPLLAGGVQAVKPMHVALAAGYIATGMAVLAFIVGFFLPEPKTEVSVE